MSLRLQHRGRMAMGYGRRRGRPRAPASRHHRPLGGGRAADAIRSHVLTYNGEIYNYPALRRTLPGPFRSHSDTECCCSCSRARGSPVFSRSGMFAFAVWERDAGSCSRCATARHQAALLSPPADGIAFASELKALLVLGTPPIDKSALRICCSTATYRRRRRFIRARQLPAGACAALAGR